MTSGQYGGRDYGHDHQAYPPQHADHDGQSDWGSGSGSSPAAGRNGHSSYGQQSGYPQPEYANGRYVGEDSPVPAYQYQEPGYQESGYRQADYDYPATGHRAAGRARDDRTIGLERRRPADTRPGDEASTRRKRRGLPLWQEVPLLLIIAFCLAILVRTFLLQAFYIPSGSMEDTLIAGDRVLVNKVVYQFRDPARGEVVVFRGPDAWAPVPTDEGDVGTFAKVGRALGDLVGVSRPGEKDFIKRVIGLPGDIVSCCSVDGQVFVNGQPLNEEYVIRDSPLDEGDGAPGDCRSRQFDEVVIQPGHMFVMGDHRLVSQDSRCQGQVPIENIIGRAFVIVWPNGRWSSLSRPDTFAGVPAPASATGALAPMTVPPGPPAELAFVLPILLPFAWTGRRRRRAGPGLLWRHLRAGPELSRSQSARSRLIGRDSGRRLAE